MMRERLSKTRQPATLEDLILTVLEHHDGLCMDEAEERDQLAQALYQALSTFLNHDDSTDKQQREER